jgi:hypothetical protein
MLLGLFTVLCHPTVRAGQGTDAWSNAGKEVREAAGAVGEAASATAQRGWEATKGYSESAWEQLKETSDQAWEETKTSPSAPGTRRGRLAAVTPGNRPHRSRHAAVRCPDPTWARLPTAASTTAFGRLALCPLLDDVRHLPCLVAQPHAYMGGVFAKLPEANEEAVVRFEKREGDPGHEVGWFPIAGTGGGFLQGVTDPFERDSLLQRGVAQTPQIPL